MFTARVLLAAALLSCAVVLLGCSEEALRSRPGPEPEDPIPVEPTPAAPSPWDDLDPGTAPELTWVAVWHDVTGLSALDENAEYPCLPGPSRWADMTASTHLSLLDVWGQVLAEVVLPEPLEQFERIELHSAGATRFLVEAERPGSAPSFLWEVDALSLEVTELLRWSRQGASSVLLLGEVTQLLPRPFTRLHSVVQGDALYVAIEQGGSSTPPPLSDPRLIRFDLGAPDASVEVLTLSDLLPAAAQASPDAPPRLTIRHLREVGEDLLLQGTYSGLLWDGSGVESPSRVVRWVLSPATGGLSWPLDLSDSDLDFWPRPVQRHEQTRAALLAELGPDPALRLLRTQGGDLSIAPGLRSCLTPWAILDALAPTAVYSTHDPSGPDDYGMELVVSHQGDDVLTLSTLRLGLSERRPHFVSLIPLE